MTILISLFGGLGLFIFGIFTLSKGLRKSAQEKLQYLLTRFTRHPFISLLLGTAVTGVIQSSSATTVMLVSFINAEILGLVPAIPIIFGANIGATITAQIISFKLDQVALPAIGIGTFLYLLSRNRSVRNLGAALLGFGLVFLGMTIMKDSLRPLSHDMAFGRLFLLGGSGIAGQIVSILIAALVTAVVQSSGATTGIILALAGSGVIKNIETAIPLIVGCHIGTCITAGLASIGTSSDAKRAAFIHVAFNIFGGILAMAFMPLYIRLVHAFTGDLLIRQAANAHTLISIIPAIVSLPMIPLYYRLSKKVIKTSRVDKLRRPKYLDTMLLETPEIALEQTIKELEHITKISRESFTQAMTGFILSERALLHKADIKIKAVDNIYKSYKQYLLKISEKDLSIRSSIDFPILFHAAKHISKVIESIGEIIDHAEKLRARNLTIPENAKPDIDSFYRLVNSMFDHLITALSHRDAGHAEKAMSVKDDVDSMKREYRDHHLVRMQERNVDVKAEWVTHDVNIRMERISDHLSHIANEIISDLQW